MSKETKIETVEATKTSFQVLEVLIDSVEPLGVTAIARRTDAHKSTVYKHLDTLRQLGYVEKTNSTYTPSIRFVDFSRHIEEQNPVPQPVKTHLDELTDTLGETTGFVIERGGIAVDVYATHNRSRTDIPPRNKRFLHCSAAGKTLLAEWSMDSARRYITTEKLPRITAHTLTDCQTVLDEISRVRDHGFAFDREEQYEGVNSVATSVNHPDWNASVYVSGKSDELIGKRFKDVIPGSLQSTVRKIESALR